MALPRARNKRAASSPAKAVAPSLTSAGLIAGAVALGAAAFLNARRAREAEAGHPPAGRFVLADGVDVHYHEAGEGPPVLLLHGNGVTGEDWITSGLFERLARHHRVIAPDRPGFGYTGRPRSRVWTPRAQAELFGAFLDRLGIERPVVVGHSWGTLVALAMAESGPVRPAGLVLLSGYYYPTARLDVALFSGPAIPVVGDLMRYTVSPPVSRMIAPALIRRVFEPRPVPKRFRRRTSIELMTRPSQLRAAAADTALMIPAAASLSPSYPDLDLPVHIVAGDGDRIVTFDRQSVRLARDIPGAALTVIEGAGHMTHYANHDRIEAAIRSVGGR